MAQPMQVSNIQTTLDPVTVPVASKPVVTAQAEAARWGWFPALVLLDSCALLIVSLGYTLNRMNVEWAAGLYWLSLLIIFVPAAYRLLSPSIARRERIGLIVALGLSLYLVKILHSPLDFTFYDEFLHWNTANHILSTAHLFAPNPLLPVSSLYPGLEIITTALSNLSGFSVVTSGVIILGIARIGFMLGLYLFYERISSSPQIGGIAALLYTANSNFIFFDSQFSYESLSLPIAVTVLFLVAYSTTKSTGKYLQHLVLILPLVFVVAFTHHLTSYVLVGILFLWAIVALLKNYKSGEWIRVGMVSVVALGITLGWSVYVGSTTSDYLAPVIRNSISEISGLILDENSGRELFQGTNGQSSPLLERVIAIGAILFILVVLPFGIFEIVRSPFQQSPLGKKVTLLRSDLLQAWQRYRSNSAAFAFAIIVLFHPIMQSFRLTSAGWEIANRSSEFIFWAIAFVITIGFFSLKSRAFLRPIWKVAFVIWASVVFIGGSISGWPPWARLPGSYLVSADTRSIEPQGIAAAKWAGEFLRPESLVATDRINSLLVAIYGHERPITHLADKTYLASVFFSPTFGDNERELIDRVKANYLLVDTRMSTSLPLVGVYFEAGEPRDKDDETPMSLAALEKFHNINNISQPFDDGNIQIYDVSAIHVNP